MTSFARRAVWCLSFAALTAACGGKGSTQSSAGGAGPGSSSSSGSVGATSSGSGGSTGAGGAPSDLSGVWDILGSQGMGAPISATLTLDVDHLNVVTDSGSFTATRKGAGFDVTFTVSPGAPHPVRAATVTAGALKLGAFPINLSGDWKVTNQPDDGLHSCSSSLSTGNLSASCAAADLVAWWLPFGLDGTATAKQTKQLTSVFGDLGGEWSLQFSGGGTCTFKLEGGSVSSDCQGANHMNGKMTATFSGDKLSGSTDAGIEFSAKRR